MDKKGLRSFLKDNKHALSMHVENPSDLRRSDFVHFKAEASGSSLISLGQGMRCAWGEGVRRRRKCLLCCSSKSTHHLCPSAVSCSPIHVFACHPNQFCACTTQHSLCALLWYSLLLTILTYFVF